MSCVLIFLCFWNLRTSTAAHSCTCNCISVLTSELNIFFIFLLWNFLTLVAVIHIVLLFAAELPLTAVNQLKTGVCSEIMYIHSSKLFY
jgi:hypothetical protein